MIDNVNYLPLERDSQFFSFSTAMTSEKINQLAERPVQKSEKMTVSDYLVAFSTKPESYCVGLVDMVGSTKIAASLSAQRLSRYYEIFLNSMSKILGRFGGCVIKNVGDCLFYYFPESSKRNSKFGFLSCLESSLAMIEAQQMICIRLKGEGLPCVDYRVSADYGSVVLMKANTSDGIDMVGPPVNMVSKINRCASKNSVVIGGDLHEIVKSYPEYRFKQSKGFCAGFRYDYPVYQVTRK